MRNKSKIQIPPLSRTRALASIRRCFTEELDQEIGDLKAGSLFDYIVTELGPTIYNQGITDARAFFDERSADLAAICDQAEFPFWDERQRSATRSPSQPGTKRPPQVR